MEGEFSSVSTPELVDEITTLAGHLNAANARFLALIAELDRRRGWAEWGVKSCAHWLNWKCGIGLGAAREKVRVARALEELPRIAAAMAEGRLSYFKAREMTRVAMRPTRITSSTSRSAGRRVMSSRWCGVTAGRWMPRSCRGRRSSSATSRSGSTPSPMARWSFVAGCRPRSERCSRRRSRRPKTACRSRKTFRPERLLTPCQRMTCTAPASAGSRHSPSWPRASWPRVRRNSPAATASRSWCMSMPRP